MFLLVTAAHRRETRIAWQVAAMARMKRLPSLPQLLGTGGPRVVRDEDKTDWQRDFDAEVAQAFDRG